MLSEVRVRVAVDRIMRIWSLIKLVPEQHALVGHEVAPRTSPPDGG